MTNTLEQKLLLFQQNVGIVKKDSKNPHFKNTYASLPQILGEVKPMLSELGLILLQPVNNGCVETIIIDSESKEKVSGAIPLPTGLTPQQMGSAITYYRRYLLAGLLSLEIDDDDANVTNKQVAKAKANDDQKNYIESLLLTATIAEEHKVFVENNLNDFTFEKAQEIIEKLKANQVDPITQKGTGNQTEIKNKLKQLS